MGRRRYFISIDFLNPPGIELRRCWCTELVEVSPATGLNVFTGIASVIGQKTEQRQVG